MDIKNKDLLTVVISEIKDANSVCDSTISEDQGNEVITGIINKFVYDDDGVKVDSVLFPYEVDSEEFLSGFFGLDGYHMIREAEQGNY